MAEAIVCARCGGSFMAPPSKPRRFCSMACYRDEQRDGGYRRGHGPNFPRNPCAHCGAVVARKLATCRDGRAADKSFCDRDCYDAFRSGLAALRVAARTTVTCRECQTSFVAEVPARQYCSNACRMAGRKAKPKHCVNCKCWFTPVKYMRARNAFTSYNGGKTCSSACQLAWISNNEERKRKISAAFSGGKHPLWQGGKSHLNNISSRGPNWQKQRAAAMKRDGYRCADCGISEDVCRAKYARGLDVDHEVPYHNFNDYKKANRLGNLKCRCASCHRKAEAKRDMVQMVLPMQDSQKRRHKGYVRGERVNTAKLTAADVLEIRRLVKAGADVRALALAKGVTAGAIWCAARGKSWKHLPL